MSRKPKRKIVLPHQRVKERKEREAHRKSVDGRIKQAAKGKAPFVADDTLIAISASYEADWTATVAEQKLRLEVPLNLLPSHTYDVLWTAALRRSAQDDLRILALGVEWRVASISREDNREMDYPVMFMDLRPAHPSDKPMPLTFAFKIGE